LECYKSRIPDILPDTLRNNYIFGKISNKFILKNSFDNHRLLQTLIKGRSCDLLIFVQIVFAALFEELFMVNKLLDHVNISRISSIRPYRISKTAEYPGHPYFEP
jgi:hypothetical protein